MDTAEKFWNEQAEWSRKIFGSDQDRGPMGPLRHLEKEAREAQEEPEILKQHMEIVDCQFLIFDAARRAGLTYEHFMELCFVKLEINKSRKWSKPTTDEPVEHIRGEEK